MKNVPSLLIPAGNMRSLKTALRFGADAVYCGLQKYSLRAQAKNFDEFDLKEAVKLCHKHGVTIYVTLNIFPYNAEWREMLKTAHELYELGVDAVIVSDVGLIRQINNEIPGLAVHVSTQANTTNINSALVYRDLGASRVVLSRELSIEDIEEIALILKGNPELEIFIHGSVCMSWSGRCMLSSFLNNRSANHGECTQPCRWSYSLMEEGKNEYYPIYENEYGTAILSSRDLCMITHLQRLIHSGVDCFKVEGRMKNELYVATVTAAYRNVIDDVTSNSSELDNSISYWRRQLDMVSHRPYDTGFYFGKPQVCGEAVGVEQEAEYIGYVIEETDKEMLVEMKNRFFKGDLLEVVTPNGIIPYHVEKIILERNGENVDVVKVPNDKAWLIKPENVKVGDLIRGPVRNRA